MRIRHLSLNVQWSLCVQHFDLNGKTILIASTHDVMAELDIGSLLEQRGAMITYVALPVHPDSPHVHNIDRSLVGSLMEDSKLPTFSPLDPDWKQKAEARRTGDYNSDINGAYVHLYDKIKNHEPKIDAIILHNTDINQESTRNAAVQFAKRIKEWCPVVVCDYCDSKGAIQSLRAVGAKCFDFDKLNFERLAAEVAKIVGEHGKPGRKLGG